jgi:hypothetical protein
VPLSVALNVVKATDVATPVSAGGRADLALALSCVEVADIQLGPLRLRHSTQEHLACLIKAGYTANDSLIGYIINSISSIILYNISNDAQYKVIALLLLFVGQMQILDYGFWKNQTCSAVNTILTKLAIVVNHLQPLVLILLQGAFGFKQSPAALILFGFYIIFGIFYNIDALTQIDCTLPEDGIMKWKWNSLSGYQYYYFFFMAYLIVAAFNFKSTTVSIATALATIITILVATKTPILNKSFGRIWCYYAALMPIAFIGLYYFTHV